MPARSVLVRATEERERVIHGLVAAPTLRGNSKLAAKKIDLACKQLDANGEQLSTRNVVRILEQLFPGDHPAESSIRNATPSGKVYRGIIEAWRTYQIARKPVSARGAHDGIEADLPDAMLLAIQPETTRMAVLLMRTALRNIRRQFQLLQSVSAERFVRNEISRAEHEVAATEGLTRADVEVLKSFLDEQQCSARGASWNSRGQLTDEHGNVLSAPGLQDVLLKIVAAQPSQV